MITVCSLLIICLLIACSRGFVYKSRHNLQLLRSKKLVSYSINIKPIILLRGGAQHDATEVEEDLDDEDDYKDNGEEDNESSRGSLLTTILVNKVTEIWNKTPPITQMHISISLLITVLSFLFNNNKWPEIFKLKLGKIFGGLQFWRLYTAFLYYGPLDLFYPLTMEFLWVYMAQLEKLSYNKPEDFLVMLLFGGATLISVYTISGISMKALGHNLATYLVYIWSRIYEGTDLNVMDIITIKAEMLPWLFCAQSYFLEKHLPVADIVGIFVGHLYYYMNEKKMLAAPAVLRNLFQSDYVKEIYARFKNDFE